MKLDEVGFCFVAIFKATVCDFSLASLAVVVQRALCRLHSSMPACAVSVVLGGWRSIASLFWWPPKNFSCPSGHILWLDENIFVIQPILAARRLLLGSCGSTSAYGVGLGDFG